ncbi:MAG: hypothetical protein GXZ11_08315 [Tissierellia bacterium]|nr:hypothetical protein [Tissierellia bacterium]
MISQQDFLSGDDHTFTDEKVYYKYLLLLSLGVFLIYWLFNRQYTGPAYLSDEIGYLSKAAAFAGYPVDMASSWHGGYSLILSPLFIIFSDPYLIWQAIMIINAILWACSFVILFCLLNKCFPGKNFRSILGTVLICAIYPSWITMSGYAFSTSCFVLFYMLSIIALQKIDISKAWTVLPHSLLAGFLYWIHPTGLAVMVASFLVVFVLSWNKRSFISLVLNSSTIVIMLVVYKFGVHEWLAAIMTPEGYTASDHYGSITEVFGNFFNFDFWKTWVPIFFGQMSYLLIASFGLVYVAIGEIWDRLKEGLHSFNSKEWLINSTMLFCFLSVLGVLLMGSLYFASNSLLRTDIVIYGRYSEMVLLPLLGIGVLSSWRFRHLFRSVLIILLSTLLVTIYTCTTDIGNYNNLVNIQSFWPQAIYKQSYTDTQRVTTRLW